MIRESPHKRGFSVVETKCFLTKVKIHCVLKDSNNKVQDIALNVPDIDQYLKTQYNKNLILLYTKEDLLKELQ